MRSCGIDARFVWLLDHIELLGGYGVPQGRVRSGQVVHAEHVLAVLGPAQSSGVLSPLGVLCHLLREQLHCPLLPIRYFTVAFPLFNKLVSGTYDAIGWKWVIGQHANCRLTRRARGTEGPRTFTDGGEGGAKFPGFFVPQVVALCARQL